MRLRWELEHFLGHVLGELLEGNKRNLDGKKNYVNRKQKELKWGRHLFNGKGM